MRDAGYAGVGDSLCPTGRGTIFATMNDKARMSNDATRSKAPVAGEPLRLVPFSRHSRRPLSAGPSVQGLGSQGPSGFVRLCQTLEFLKSTGVGPRGTGDETADQASSLPSMAAVAAPRRGERAYISSQVIRVVFDPFWRSLEFGKRPMKTKKLSQIKPNKTPDIYDMRFTLYHGSRKGTL